jgi:hypothetical protein
MSIGGFVNVYRIIENSQTTTISEVAKLTASNGMFADGFGFSVAISGKHILVGAPGAGMNNTYQVGSAYLFGNPSSDPSSPEWTELQQFQPSDLSEYDMFGEYVAMDDTTAVVATLHPNATSSAVYVFSLDAQDSETESSSSSSSSLLTPWTQTAKLTGELISFFGFSLAVAGNWIVVGAPYITSAVGGSNTSAVFVFNKQSSSWTQMTRLLADDGMANHHDNFGVSVSISNNTSTIVVGAPYHDYNTTLQGTGAAYLFQLTGSEEWTQTGKIIAANSEFIDIFGFSVAAENDVFVVGAPGDDSSTGSVHVFDTGLSSSRPPTEMTMPFPTTEPVTVGSPTTSTPPLQPSPTVSNMDPTNNSPPAANTSPTDQQSSDSSTAFSLGAIAGMSAIVGVTVFL